ncbi:unnamed protein product [Caenorhabditis brenneri]
MILHTFFYFFTISIVFSFPISDDCTGFLSYESACNKIILELVQDWVSNKPIPSAKVSKSLYSDCRQAIDCTRMIECPEKNKEISKKLADLGEFCSGILAFSSSFGQCTTTIRSKESSREYPCLKYWDNLEQSPTCEFFESDYDCAEMLVENQCGVQALDEMKKNRNFISKHFGCKIPTAGNSTKSKSDDSSEEYRMKVSFLGN